MSYISMKQLRAFVRKMRLTDGSVILIKHGTPLGEIDNVKRLMEVVEQTSYENVVVLVVDDFDNISTKDPKEMNELGWYHIDQIRRAAHASPKKEEG